MTEILNWGLTIIKQIQSVLPDWSIKAINGFTQLGSPVFYLIALPLLFCISKKKGYRLAWLVLFSITINTIIKFALSVPRPYVMDPTVGKAFEDSFSTPSGHAQISTVFWVVSILLFGEKIKQPWKTLIMVLMPLFIGLSRVCLGVHYPSDVIFGWALGLVTAFGSIYLWDPIVNKLNLLPKMYKILLAAVFTFVFNMLCPQDTSFSGALFGFTAGYILLAEKKYSFSFGSMPKKILGTLLEIAAIGLVYFVFKLVFPQKGSEYYQLFRFIRYCLLGFSATYIVPRLFVVFKLASEKGKADA